VSLPDGSAGGRLPGYVLFYACEDVDGRCLFLRRDIEIELRAPGAD
jgi:hypothetical protein